MASRIEGLSVTTRRHGTAVTVAARGALDLATADDLRAAVMDVAAGTRVVVVDLRALQFVDSSGLGTLLNLRAALARLGIRLSVRADDGPVRRALETTGLQELLAD